MSLKNSSFWNRSVTSGQKQPTEAIIFFFKGPDQKISLGYATYQRTGQSQPLYATGPLQGSREEIRSPSVLDLANHLAYSTFFRENPEPSTPAPIHGPLDKTATPPLAGAALGVHTQHLKLGTRPRFTFNYVLLDQPPPEAVDGIKFTFDSLAECRNLPRIGPPELGEDELRSLMLSAAALLRAGRTSSTTALM